MFTVPKCAACLELPLPHMCWILLLVDQLQGYPSPSAICRQLPCNLVLSGLSWDPGMEQEIPFSVVTLFYVYHRTTNKDGRCPNLLTAAQLNPGTYRVHFDTTAYFSSTGNHEPFYPYVEVSISQLTNTEYL